MHRAEPLHRRSFLQQTVATSIATFGMSGIAAPSEASKEVRDATKIPLGFDNFSIRAKKWEAARLIQFAGDQKLDSLLLSDLDVYQNHQPKYLKSLKEQADAAGVQLHCGTGGICPTSGRFIKKWGTAVEHLKLGIRIAKTLGSPVFRCYLGHAKDRQGPGGIQRHIDATVEVLKQVEKDAVAAKVKIAVENHAGDMQACELVQLIEQAGKHFVGATIDSGNATWTLESPARNLEILGPYAISSGMRDSSVWETEQGAAVAWNAIGEGQVDWKAYTSRFAELCPGVPFQLEIISGFNRAFDFKKDEFWKPYGGVSAQDYESFLRMARVGKPVAKNKANDPEYQMAELMRSIQYCRAELGMGIRS